MLSELKNSIVTLFNHRPEAADTMYSTMYSEQDTEYYPH